LTPPLSREKISNMSVIVFGSINIDLVAKTHRLPVPGETVAGHTFFTAPGGKGANQAVAAARLGVPARLIGRVGDDSFGKELLASLQAAGVDTGSVSADPAASTGIAAIAADDAGQNTIVIIAGANGCVGDKDCDRVEQLLPGAAALLLQLEIPLSAVLTAARAARAAGVPVILDPAPARADIPAELYSLTDIITPNEIEASQLAGFPVSDRETAALAAAEFRRRGAGTAIVKLGDRGVFCATAEESFFVPAFPVPVADTVAAGDAFSGALAAAIAAGKPLRQAVIWGAAAGALCATKAGAQPSLPHRHEFEAFLRERSVEF